MAVAGELGIIIKTTADLAGLEAARAGMASLRDQMQAGVAGLQQAAQGMTGALQAGASGAATMRDGVAGVVAQAANLAAGASAAIQAVAKLETANEEVKEHASLTNQATEAWVSFGERLKEGLTLGFGVGIAEKAIEGVHELVAEFENAVKEGVHFNAEVETLTIGLAGALRQAQPGKYLNFTQARSAAEEAIGAIQAKANALGLDFKAVGEAVQTSMLPLVEGGITKIDQQIEVMTLLMAASSAKGIQGFQAQRDAMDLLAGRADRVMLGRELGITNADVKTAQEAGTLYGLLTTKLSAYREAGEAAAQTFNGLWASVQSVFAQLEGTAAKPLFEELKGDLAQIKTSLDSIQAKGIALGTANIFGGLITGAKAVYDSVSAAAKIIYEIGGWADIIRAAGDAAGHPIDTAAYAAQLDANQKIVLSLRDQVREAGNVEQREEARKAVLAAIAQAQEQVATATGDQKTAAETLLTSLRAVEASIGRTTTGTHEAAGAAGDMTSALAASNKELGDMVAKLPALIDGLRQAAHAADIANQMAAATNATEKLGIQTKEQASLLQYVNDQAAKLGQAPVSNLKEVDDMLQRIKDHATTTRLPSTGMLGATAPEVPAALKPGADPAAIENIASAYRQLIPINSQITSLQREQTAEIQKQADTSRKYIEGTQQEVNLLNLKTQANQALAAGDQQRADALNKQVRAVEMEKQYNDELAKTGKAYNDLTEQEKSVAWEKVSATFGEKDAQEAVNDAKKAGHAADRSAAAAAKQERAEQKFDDEQRVNAVSAIRAQIADIKSDPLITADEKEGLLRDLIAAENKLLADNIAY